MIENPKVKLPEYISHKRVRALEIKVVGNYSMNAEGALVREIDFMLPAFGPILCPEVMFARYVPLPGDFLVEYEDGYRSFSPRKAFVEGYSVVPEGNVLMERLNDIASTPLGTPHDKVPQWLHAFDWYDQLSRVAREAYITINSLKLQLENIKRGQANNPETERRGSNDAVTGAAGVHPAADASAGERKEG